MAQQLRRFHHARKHLAHVLPLVPGLTWLRPEQPQSLPLVSFLPEAGEPAPAPYLPSGGTCGTSGSTLGPDVQGPLDMNLMAREVHVRPLEAQRLAHAHAGEGERLKQRNEGGGHSPRGAERIERAARYRPARDSCATPPP
jgi:hypothetical protein